MYLCSRLKKVMADTINIGAIMEERFGRRIPRFVVGWMRRFFHEDFMNEFLRRGLSGVEFCTEATKYLGLNVSVEGLDRIPCMGREQDSVEDSRAVGGELARTVEDGSCSKGTMAAVGGGLARTAEDGLHAKGAMVMDVEGKEKVEVVSATMEGKGKAEELSVVWDEATRTERGNLHAKGSIAGEEEHLHTNGAKEVAAEEKEKTEEMSAAGEGEKLYTFVSNHPLGGADGVVLMGILGRKYGGRVRTMVNDFLMNLKGFAPLCVPVNKMGGQAAELPRLTEEMFASDNQVLMFPAGKCSRRIHGKVQDVAWSKTFIDKSVRHHRDIVPIRFIGRNSKRFYLIARLTKKMKFNVAMAFLPDEMYRVRGKSFRIVFGRPIPWQHFDASRSKREWAQWVRGEVYKLN